MIRVYPSRLPGEPLEVHQHGDTTVDAWLRANVPGYPGDGPQPIEIDVDGSRLPVADWVNKPIDSDSDMRIYPVPRDPGTWALVATLISVAFQVYTYFTTRGASSSAQDGTAIDLNPAKANGAKLGDPIREILGRQRVYPDYLVQPVSRFVGGTSYQTNLFVCVGHGSHQLPIGGMRIGTTPVTSFGDDVSLTVYGPGADVSGDARSENWFNSTEVSSTSSGTAGLDLSDTADNETSVSADSVTVSGDVLTLNNATQTNDDGDEEPATDPPASWVAGAVLTVKVAATYTASTSGLYSVISGAAVDELVPTVGMPILLTYNEADYSVYIASYTAGAAAIPGVGGSAAEVTGSAAVSTLDFSTTPASVSLTWHGTTYTVTLGSNYITIGVLVQAISDQLAGSGLAASQSDGVLTIGESASPYAGGSITYSSLPVSLFGSAPASIAGTATSGGRAATQPSITLAYDSATGTAFSGIPEGSVTLAMGRGGSEYLISAISGLTVTVVRLTEAGVQDTSWTGWEARTATDYSVTGLEESEIWLGPFLACPDGEKTDAIEYDFNFSSGLARYTSKGKRRSLAVTLRVAYRAYGSGDLWTVRSHTYSGSTEDGLGYSERITLAQAVQVEMRVRRVTERRGGSARDIVYWQGLRARLSNSPTSYDGLTTIGLTVTTGTKLGAQSDRRFNVLATREYDEGQARTISGAYYHLAKSLGFTDNQIDRETIGSLETNYWTPRGEFFDHSADKDSTSGLDIFKLITQAGMGYFLLSDGLASAGREGIKAWTGAISPQRMTQLLETSFVAPSEDDYDGVDVTYTDEVTWASETVECRLPGSDTARKVEAFKLDGVGTRDRAYRIGMRRLMKHQGQRLTHSCSTSRIALVYDYGDRVKLFDDIPGSTSKSCVIEQASIDGALITIAVGEQLDWTISNPRCLIRFQDGSASGVLTPTRIDDYTLSIAADSLPDEHGFATWALDSPWIDAPELIFCDSSRVGYDATISEIAPNDDGTLDVTALQYDESFYQYDDATAP